MKRFLIFLLMFIYCACASVLAIPPRNCHCHNGHHGHHKQYGHHGGHRGYHHGYYNSSEPKRIIGEDYFENKTPFGNCKEHNLLTGTKVLYYSDGSRFTINKYSILDNKDNVIADNLTYVKHNITTKGKHYFIAKNPAFCKKFIILNNQGERISDNCYKKYEFLGKDRLIVNKDNLYGIIDYDEKELADIKYKFIKPNGNYLITKYNGFYGLMNDDGKDILSNEYDKITYIGKVYITKKNHKYGIVSYDGKIIYNNILDKVVKNGDYLKIKLNKLNGILDLNGNEILPPKYKKIRIERNKPQVYLDRQWCDALKLNL